MLSNWQQRADEWWARLKAREVIGSLKIKHPSDISIENIAWTQGALVVEAGLRGCDARLVCTPGVRPAILRVKNSLSPPGKKRFAIAHELGHLKLSHNPGEPTECADEEFHAWYKDQRHQEAEANIFAAELLMPESLFSPRLENSVPSFETIESLASEFQTTLTATAIRYVQLSGQKCAIVCTKAGEVLCLAEFRLSSLDKTRKEVESEHLRSRFLRKAFGHPANAGSARSNQGFMDRRRIHAGHDKGTVASSLLVWLGSNPPLDRLLRVSTSPAFFRKTAECSILRFLKGGFHGRLPLGISRSTPVTPALRPLQPLLSRDTSEVLTSFLNHAILIVLSDAAP